MRSPGVMVVGRHPLLGTPLPRQINRTPDVNRLWRRPSAAGPVDRLADVVKRLVADATTCRLYRCGPDRDESRLQPIGGWLKQKAHGLRRLVRLLPGGGGDSPNSGAFKLLRL